jgi:hypothetical protein
MDIYLLETEMTSPSQHFFFFYSTKPYTLLIFAVRMIKRIVKRLKINHIIVCLLSGCYHGCETLFHSAKIAYLMISRLMKKIAD